MSTLPEIIRRAGRAFAGRVAVVDGTRRATFADVDDRSIRLANALGAITEPGQRVAILMQNRLEYIEADLALARGGLVKVPINPRLSDDERKYLIEDSGATVVITEAAELDRLRSVLSPGDVTIVSVDGGTETLPYADLLAAASPLETIGPSDPDRLSMLLYTSGTTGRPKGAMLLDRCRVAGSTMMLAEEFPLRPDDGMVHAGPLSHGSGSKVVTFYSRGARNIVMPKFDPDAFVHHVMNDGGTTSFMVPTMIQMLLDLHKSKGGNGVWGLRNITYGGASISRETMVAALDAFGPILTQVYGSCEAPHPVTVLRHRDEEDPYVSAHEIVPAGRETIGIDLHWYKTGDVARARDADGMLTIIDRTKDIIITGGLNVYPAEVERVLRDLPGVKDVAVVGLPDGRWGEIVAVAIVTDSTDAVSAAQVDEWVSTRLANYKKPRRVAFMDELPKGSTGKVIKRGLRELLTEQPG